MAAFTGSAGKICGDTRVPGGVTCRAHNDGLPSVTKSTYTLKLCPVCKRNKCRAANSQCSFCNWNATRRKERKKLEVLQLKAPVSLVEPGLIFCLHRGILDSARHGR